MKYSVYKLSELAEIIYEMLVVSTRPEDRGHEILVHCSEFGSQIYHPSYAIDRDVLVVLTGLYTTDYYTKLVQKLNVEYLGQKCDLKVKAFSDLDSIELMEMEYSISIGKSASSDNGSGRAKTLIESAIPQVLIEKEIIRHSISQKCSNSFVKAKKKLTVEKDYDRYTSLKSLFHSIRMAGFACRYAKDGMIKPDEYKWLYLEIMDDYKNNNDEEVLSLINTKYKKLFNETMSRFRLYYPK